MSFNIMMANAWKHHAKLSMIYNAPLETLTWPSSRENLILLHANSKDTCQPAHPHNLLSAFAVPSLEYNITA